MKNAFCYDDFLLFSKNADSDGIFLSMSKFISFIRFCYKFSSFDLKKVTEGFKLFNIRLTDEWVLTFTETTFTENDIYGETPISHMYASSCIYPKIDLN